MKITIITVFVFGVICLLTFSLLAFWLYRSHVEIERVTQLTYQLQCDLTKYENEKNADERLIEQLKHDVSQLNAALEMEKELLLDQDRNHHEDTKFL